MIGSYSGRLFGVLLCMGVSASALADDRPDQDTDINVAPHASSQLYERPKDAEYFWWDIEPSIDVELTFDDGTKTMVDSDKELSKKIVSVTFVNKGSAPAIGKLHARF